MNWKANELLLLHTLTLNIHFLKITVIWKQKWKEKEIFSHFKRFPGETEKCVNASQISTALAPNIYFRTCFRWILIPIVCLRIVIYWCRQSTVFPLLPLFLFLFDSIDFSFMLTFNYPQWFILWCLNSFSSMSSFSWKQTIVQNKTGERENEKEVI